MKGTLKLRTASLAAAAVMAAGLFANDALPEEKAKDLQAVVVNIETPVAL